MSYTFAHWTQKLIELGLDKHQRDELLGMIIEGIDINVELDEFRMSSPMCNVYPVVDNQTQMLCDYMVDVEGVNSNQISRVELPTIDYGRRDLANVKITYCLQKVPDIKFGNKDK